MKYVLDALSDSRKILKKEIMKSHIFFSTISCFDAFSKSSTRSHSQYKKYLNSTRPGALRVNVWYCEIYFLLRNLPTNKLYSQPAAGRSRRFSLNELQNKSTRLLVASSSNTKDCFCTSAKKKRRLSIILCFHV